MNKEQILLGIRQRLEAGVEVTRKDPAYWNAVVGRGYVGYILDGIHINSKQYHVVLKVRHGEELLREPSSITMYVHGVSYMTASGEDKWIDNLPLIGQKVILSSVSQDNNVFEVRERGPKIMDGHYRITGTLKLR